MLLTECRIESMAFKDTFHKVENVMTSKIETHVLNNEVAFIIQ